MLIPFRRNPLRATPEIEHRDLLCFCENRLEGFPTSNLPVDTVGGIDTAQCRIRKVPLAGVETISMINEQNSESPGLAASREDSLPAIGVGQPLVQHKNLPKADEARRLFEDAL